ncbi:MAG: carbamate kinase [Odoribacteraceae bacterium]|jgi:carbamate kinase|nr:carbamate kinase [Odoribacteraceae bacterium]
MDNQKTKLAVIALGGNALSRGNQRGTVEEQNANTVDTLESLIYLARDGYNLIISHGNGPQVGSLLADNAAGIEMYGNAVMPMDVCVAFTQGQLGYMIERNLRNILNKHGIRREVISMVSQVIVDKNDPAMRDPVKRIGKIYNRAEADLLAASKGWAFKEEPKVDGGWRRVVPSPSPVDFMNADLVERLARAGNIVITAGGGGIPVYRDEAGEIHPVEGVIDKDLASAMVGIRVHADELYILTDVPYIYQNYRQPDQKILEFLDYRDTLAHLRAGTFAEGSMAPKIRACLHFVKHGGAKAVITEATKLEDRRYGSKITMNYEDDRR